MTHPPAAPSALDAPPSGSRILLVEDCAPNQMLAAAILGTAGHTVDVVENGRAAVAAVARGGYDLVLMDLAMPEMDGLTAARLMRDLPPPLCRIPIIAITADSQESDRARCLAAGMDDHLAKPFDRAALLERVAHWLGRVAGLHALARTPEAAPAPGRTGVEMLDRATLDQLAADLDAEVLADVLRQFAGETMDRLERIAAETDLALLAREAHTLKSTAGTFGAPTLAAAARALELACRAGSADEAEALRAAIPDLARAAIDAYRRAGYLE